MQKRWIRIGLILLALLLAGCSPAEEATPEPFVGASITGASLDTTEAGTEIPFTVSVARAGDPVGIDCRGTLIAGRLKVQFTTGEGEVFYTESLSTPGPFAVNTVLYPPEGEYRLGLAWEEPVQVQYNLTWKPYPIEAAAISPMALIAGLGMILVAAGYIGYALKSRLGTRYLLLGALSWVITVALKFAWAIPFNTPIYNALYRALPEAIAAPLFYLYVGALTGVFEVGVTWLVIRYTRLGRASWGRALAFGIGFGALEALLLGMSALPTVIAAIAAPNSLPLDTLQTLAQANNPLYSLAPVVERLFTVLVHICANLLLFYAVAKKQPRWFWLACIYKTGIDVVAAWAQVTGVETLGKIWTVETIVIVWGLVGWWGIRQMQAHYPALDAVATAESAPTF